MTKENEVEVYEQIVKYILKNRGSEFSISDLQANIECKDKMKIRRALIDLEGIVEEDPHTHLWGEVVWQLR